LTQRLLVYEEQWHNSYGEEKVDSPCLTAEQSSKGPTSSSRPWATCLSKTPAAGYKPKNKVLGQAFLRRPTCAAQADTCRWTRPPPQRFSYHLPTTHQKFGRRQMSPSSATSSRSSKMMPGLVFFVGQEFHQTRHEYFD
jgi:hypothetical protein